MMNINKISARVANKMTAQDDRDEAMEMVDQAVDAIIAALISLEENLPLVKTDNVPEKAAIGTVTNLLDEAIKPYFADIVKTMQVFETKEV
jgi:hypothetical protein